MSHCGAGCTLDDILAEFTVFGLGSSVAGFTQGAEYIGNSLAAIREWGKKMGQTSWSQAHRDVRRSRLGQAEASQRHDTSS